MQFQQRTIFPIKVEMKTLRPKQNSHLDSDVEISLICVIHAIYPLTHCVHIQRERYLYSCNK